MGLQLLNRSSTKEACGAACCDDPACEVWQWATKRSDRNPAGTKAMSCYTGKGFECRSVRTDDFLVYAGQRISHGTQLGDGVWCTGNGMRKSPYSSRLSHKERMDNCRSACFFDKDCHVWQYSTLKGCWSGSPSYGSIKCYKDVSLAGSIMDGQRFDRSCEAAGELNTNYLQVFLVILSAALLLVCFAACVLFFNLCGPKTPKTPRGPSSSRRQEADDEEASDDLDHVPEDLSRAGMQGGAYRALYPNSSPPGSTNPSMSIPMSEGSMGHLMPPSPAGSGQLVPGASPPRPVDVSFGAVSGVSSGSSFGQGTTPLLQQYPGQMQPIMMQPGPHGSVASPGSYPASPMGTGPMR